MIPREILKKIRQIEIRTNRIVTETHARVLSTQAGVLNREIRQIREKGKSFSVLFRSRISRGSRFNLFGSRCPGIAK